MVKRKSYRVKGCEEDCRNDIYDFEEETPGKVLWWWSRSKHKMLRYTPGWGWCLGWYTHSEKDTDVDIPPKTGWTFNGGRCAPPTLGQNIIIEPLK